LKAFWNLVDTRRGMECGEVKVVSLVVRGFVCMVFIGCIKLLFKRGGGYVAVE
jgi:hypothetical protein